MTEELQGPSPTQILGAVLASVPAVLGGKGRVAGFEHLRDVILEHASDLRLPWDRVIKMVLETDRHALFSQVAEEKARSRFELEKWSEFQGYLEEDVKGGEDLLDSIVPPETKESPRGKKQGKAKGKVRRANQLRPDDEKGGVRSGDRQPDRREVVAV